MLEGKCYISLDMVHSFIASLTARRTGRFGAAPINKVQVYVP